MGKVWRLQFCNFAAGWWVLRTHAQLKPFNKRFTMKNPTHYALGLVVLAALLSNPARAEERPAGYVDFGKFSPPATGKEFVEIDVKSNLVAMVARMAKESEPEVAQLLRGLQSV